MGRLKNPRHEAFCQLYVHGDPRHDPRDSESPPDCRHRHRESYEAAGYRARGESARVLGYELLRRADVQTRILEIREELVEVARSRRFRWSQLYPEAQELLLRAARGEEVTGPQVAAAREIVAREEGSLAFKFRDPKSGKEKTGIPVYVLGSDDDEEVEEDE
jgi:hypothetical protein